MVLPINVILYNVVIFLSNKVQITAEAVEKASPELMRLICVKSVPVANLTICYSAIEFISLYLAGQF